MPNSATKDVLRSFLPGPRSPKFRLNQRWDQKAWYHHAVTSYHFFTSQFHGVQVLLPVAILGLQHALHWWFSVGMLQAWFYASLIVLLGKRLYKTLYISRVLLFSPKVQPLNLPLHSLSSNVSEDLGTYVHTPLQNENCLRLLLLKSGRFDDELKCELLEFSSDTVTSYEALSYVWGSKPTDKYILCSSKRISITDNCDAALRHLRLITRGRMLWVDSICIG
jgi:hypothetical protein